MLFSGLRFQLLGPLLNGLGFALKLVSLPIPIFKGHGPLSKVFFECISPPPNVFLLGANFFLPCQAALFQFSLPLADP